MTQTLSTTPTKTLPLATKICGDGAACERACPVMKIGRACPPLTEWLDEIATI